VPSSCSRRQAPAIEQPAGGDDWHLLAHGIDHLGHEGDGGDGAGMAPGLRALGHDEVAPAVDGGNGVAHLASHRADQDVALVQQLDGVARHPEAGHEGPGAARYDVADLVGDLAGQRGQEIDAERLGREVAHLGHLGHHLLGPHRRRAHAPEAARLRHGGDEAVVRDAAHPGQHDGVLDLEEVGESGAHGASPYGRRRVG
jgi:hypothetical protein